MLRIFKKKGGGIAKIWRNVFVYIYFFCKTNGNGLMSESKCRHTLCKCQLVLEYPRTGQAGNGLSDKVTLGGEVFIAEDE